MGDNATFPAPFGQLAAREAPSRAELATVVGLVRALRADLVNVGYGRTPRSIASANAFIESWEAAGGQIGAVVSWPSVAASWLRPAGRLAAGAPDAWVVADTTEGWASIGRRLAATGRWWAPRTIAFEGLADPLLPSVTGFEASEGLSGSLSEGTVWTFRDGLLVTGSPGGDR